MCGPRTLLNLCKLALPIAFQLSCSFKIYAQLHVMELAVQAALVEESSANWKARATGSGHVRDVKPKVSRRDLPTRDILCSVLGSTMRKETFSLCCSRMQVRGMLLQEVAAWAQTRDWSTAKYACQVTSRATLAACAAPVDKTSFHQRYSPHLSMFWQSLIRSAA